MLLRIFSSQVSALIGPETAPGKFSTAKAVDGVTIAATCSRPCCRTHEQSADGMQETDAGSVPVTDDFDPDDWPNDYSHPAAIASTFASIEDRLKELEKKERDRSGEAAIWLFGSAIAIALSWSRNASILYCIGHGLASWIYVIYFAFTR
ncbi:MAG TPA: hypothetical protein VMP68_00570 [Candidatus Eisenbacteria bacterium]|nr:hypothetical protein [Candidatus Eisenbacteria bacterium]